MTAELSSLANECVCNRFLPGPIPHFPSMSCHHERCSRRKFAPCCARAAMPPEGPAVPTPRQRGGMRVVGRGPRCRNQAQSPGGFDAVQAAQAVANGWCAPVTGRVERPPRDHRQLWTLTRAVDLRHVEREGGQLIFSQGLGYL
ncbi:unnamed protein product [Arctogadus glacialis]